MLAKLTTYIGKDAFEKLSDKEKALFKLFVWVGCGCHKDLNTVLGGYMYLSKFWSENGLQGPVLLPNKFNAAIINDAPTKDNDDSDAVHHAVKNSTKGAVKATKTVKPFQPPTGCNTHEKCLHPNLVLSSLFLL